MRKTNNSPSFGLLFTTAATMVSPMHEMIVQKPLYGSIPKLTLRSWTISLIQESVRVIDRWRQRASQRKSLGLLSDHMLNDIGLDRNDVRNELSKPFWRP